MMNRVPMDTVVFLALGAACISRLDRTSSALLIILLGAYAALELVSSPMGRRTSAAFVLRAKLTLAALAISLVVILPTISGMVLRHASEPWSYVHDAAMQVEEAIRFLLQARNPYAENYLETPLAQWEYAFPPPEVNPALYHNAYLPFIFLFSAPLYACSTWLTGWYDQRLVFLLLFLTACWLYMQHGRSVTRRLSLLIVFGPNLFGVSHVIWGEQTSLSSSGSSRAHTSSAGTGQPRPRYASGSPVRASRRPGSSSPSSWSMRGRRNDLLARGHCRRQLPQSFWYRRF